MERIKEFGSNCARLFKRSKRKEEVADFNFVTDFKEEKFSFIWRIENIHRCELKPGEFLESPVFSTRSCSEVKWTLRFYPRGRNTENSRQKVNCPEHKHLERSCEIAGLYICKISTNPATSSFACQFAYKREFNRHINVHPEEVTVAGIKLDLTESSNWGTDSFLCTDIMVILQTLLIKCRIYVTNAYNKEVPGNDNHLDFSKSDSLFGALKAMLENGKFSDVALQVGDKKFLAHKAILASRSEVFDAMFQHDMKETQTNVVQIEDIEPTILSNLLEYIYTGSVEDFNIEKAVSLYPVANKYLLEDLKKWCIDIMLANLKVENVCQIAVLVDLYPDTKLKEATFNMFRNYTSDIFKRKEWKDLIVNGDRRSLVSDVLQAVSADFTTNCSDA